MRAVVKFAEGEGNIELRDVPEPKTGDNEVKIKVKAVGICGSDLHIFNWDIGIPTKVPFTIGHEFSGIIAEVGKNVRQFKGGERVTAENSRFTCGSCRCCMTGNYNLCKGRLATGYAYDGAYADYCVVPENRVHLLPDNVDFITAALTDPSACVYHAVQDLTGVNAGDMVLITGSGAMGLFCVQYVRVNGGIPVITGLNQDKNRLMLARELGAYRTINVSKEDLNAVINEITQGKGVDIALECSGNQSAAESCLNLLRRQGKYTQIGIFGKPVTIDLDKVLYGEIQMTGSFSQKHLAWKAAIELASQGKILARPLVTDILPLESWEEGFKRSFEGKAIKVVFKP
jgi:L-iditol 2-dehydrogenase